jgi:hypothetical protein
MPFDGMSTGEQALQIGRGDVATHLTAALSALEELCEPMAHRA